MTARITALLVALALAACAAGTGRDGSKTDTRSDRAPHFSPGAAVTGGTVRGNG